MSKRNFRVKNNWSQVFLLILSCILLISSLLGIFLLFEKDKDVVDDEYLVVSYYIEDDLYKKQFYQYGETINLVDADKYVWKFEDDTLVDTSHIITDNICLYAQSFTITFIVDGVELDVSKTLYGGNSYGNLPTPTREDYTFAGWYSADGILATSSSIMGTSDVVLYAHWTSPVYNVICEYDTTTSSYVVIGTEYKDATTITIPSTYDDGVNGVAFVTAIGERAFDECSMTSVTIPSTIISIGTYAFSYCRGLTEIVLPDNLTYLGNRVFMCCNNLTTINIPQGITSIYEHTFYACGFTSLIIPSHITRIETYAFYYSHKLTDVKFEDNSQLEYLGQGAFGECDILESVELPSSLKTIDKGAFYKCVKLNNIAIPENVKNIADRVFYDCTNLTTLTILAIVPPTLSSVNAISSATTTIYIVGELDVYSNADKWSNFTNAFVKL